jgi:hypothetical protein
MGRLTEIKYTISLDVLIVLVIVNIFLSFIMFTRYKIDYKNDLCSICNKISVLEEKVAWTEDMLLKGLDEQNKCFYEKINKKES